MKINSLLSHFFHFFPDAIHHTDASRKVAASRAVCAGDRQPTLVFRGIRYQKEDIAPNAALVEARAKAPRVFRGASYVAQSMSNELASPRQKAVRVFRGIVVNA